MTPQVHAYEGQLAAGLQTFEFPRHPNQPGGETVEHLLLVRGWIFKIRKIGPKVPDVVDELGKRFLERGSTHDHVKFEAADHVLAVRLYPPDAFREHDLMIADALPSLPRLGLRLGWGLVIPSYAGLFDRHLFLQSPVPR